MLLIDALQTLGDQADPWLRKTFASTPEVLAVFDDYPFVVMRADLLRLLVLLSEGGLYSDLDTQCPWLSSRAALTTQVFSRSRSGRSTRSCSTPRRSRLLPASSASAPRVGPPLMIRRADLPDYTDDELVQSQLTGNLQLVQVR